MDKWIPIKGYENDYLIDIEGNIMSKRTSKLLTHSTDTPGYKYVRLNQKNHTIHRLIAIHFIPNPENKRCVNHINGIKTDFSINNLEWCTHAENMRHATDMGLNYGLKRGSNSKAKKIINIKTGEVFDCGISACETTEFKYCTFLAMLSGRFKNKSDFRWL